MVTRTEPPSLDDWLTHRGRFVDVTFLVRCDADECLVQIQGGKIVSVTHGPFVMPRWTFALSASRDAWQRYWAPEPTPGFHDLLALVKYRRLKIEGDQAIFMANLLYFKDVMALLGEAVLEG